jgi:hypothetical protein
MKVVTENSPRNKAITIGKTTISALAAALMASSGSKTVGSSKVQIKGPSPEAT